MIFAYIDPGTGFTFTTLAGWLIAFLISFLGIFALFFRRMFRFLKKYKRRIIVVLLIIITLALTIRGAFMNKKESGFDRKFIILGFDGLSPEIIEPMMDQAKLPNFYKLKQKGSYGRLSTTNPSQSPVAWAAFATGQNPGKNGIYDFITRNPKTYGLGLSLSNIDGATPKRTVNTKSFWQYTSKEKIPTVIITCPVTFPPDEVYGRMLSGMGVPDILGTEGTFSFYTSEPLTKDRDTGGKVFEVKKSSRMFMHLIGPRISTGAGTSENTKVPFTVSLQEDQGSIFIEYQKNKFELKEGEWSEWKEVVFKISMFKKARGILKFYLVEANREFKLYASPINFDPRNPLFQISFPKAYAKELADNIGLYYTQGMPADTWAVNEKRLTEGPLLEQLNEVLRQKREMLDFELNRFNKGLLFCYFESPDIIQHMFWRYTDTKHPLYEKDQVYEKIIKNWYVKMDEILGSVMDRMDEEDTLIVLSDHGFNTFRRAAHINSWLRKNGYLELKNPHTESGRELLEDIDWSKTMAYAIGFGAIYINQKGREREGIVAPGRETELLKEEISQKIKGWIDEKYNESIIKTVYKREDIFWGSHIDETPDLYLGFNIGYRASWQTALGAVPKELIEDNQKKWSGSHLFDPTLVSGVLFCNRSVTKNNASIYDIAPTILKIIGFDDEKLRKCDFDGAPLFY
ncbi:alkaline phosphatase family protein [Candidatus Omnitrophota bacterium]